ncbi:hypothetical protein M422DRAFT_31910 [Sphaerobolus stellatus SS14]|uniref:Cupin type-1 domain-containing protein n=1 Tax=Sphaerobolus stellatus (strain SS14) TaxID=990650 RepID=A0A0C9VRP8_SPHS4|nr:hypothetical protein M422DRAFT_31910 [Sphaerobolus stellatus SS14]
MAATTELLAKLFTDATEAAKFADLKDSDFVFDFHNVTPAFGDDGVLIGANIGNWPALKTGNGAMTVGILGPCGLNTPHTHPDATEIQLLLTGGPLLNQMVMENGVRLVQDTVTPGSAMVFPQGSMHFQQSLSCGFSFFVSSFDYYDPGTLQAAQTLAEFDKGVIKATFGQTGVQYWDNIKLPKNVVLGAQSCLDTCGISRDTFNFNETFAEYVLSVQKNGSYIPSLDKVMTSYNVTPVVSTAAVPTAALSSTNRLLASDDSTGNMDIPFSQNPLRPVIFGLSALSAVLLLALIITGIAALRARRSRKAYVSHVPDFHAESRGYPYNTPYDDGVKSGLPRGSSETLTATHS